MADTLTALAALIKSRRNSKGDTSYTRQLLDGGRERCAKKFGEEAVETVIAAVSQSNEALMDEAADVLYHLLVLLESRDVAWSDVLAKLDGRMGTGGLTEKAARMKS
jgi:phosphoribosyl-ATP pyrophosphohydrolase